MLFIKENITSVGPNCKLEGTWRVGVQAELQKPPTSQQREGHAHCSLSLPPAALEDRCLLYLVTEPRISETKTLSTLLKDLKSTPKKLRLNYLENTTSLNF